MKRKRDLLVTNILAAPILIAALLAGWREAAAFGLAVLIIMDLLVVLGERWPRRPSHSAESPDLIDEQEPTPEAEPDPEHGEAGEKR
jgi:hypothetical protein